MKRNSTLTKVAKGSAITFVGTFLGVLLQFGSRALFARVLGADYYGVLMLGLSVLYLVNSVGGLGLNVGVARFVPHYQTQNEPGKLKGVILLSLIIPAVVGVILGAVLFGATPVIALELFHDAALIPVLRVFAGLIPVLAVLMTLEGIVRGFQRMDCYLYMDQGMRQGGLLVVGLAAFLFGFDIVDVTIGYGITFLATVGVGWYLLVRIYPDIHRKTVRAENVSGELFRFSWPLVVSQQLGESRRRADTLIVGYFSPSALVGLYNAAMPIAKLLQMPLTAVNRILMPSLSNLHAGNEVERMHSTYKTVARWTFFLTLPLFATVVIHAESFLRLIFGSEYAGARVPLIILAFGFFVNASSGSFGEALIAMGKPRINMYSALTAVILNVILGIMLIPLYGLTGAAIAAGGSLVGATAVGGGYLYFHFGLHPLSKGHIKAVLAMIVPVFGLAFMKSHVHGNLILWMLPGLIVMAYLLFVGGLFVLNSFNEWEMNAFSAARKRVYHSVLKQGITKEN